MDKPTTINVMRRYEVKYILTKEQLAYLKPRLLERMKIDRYGMTTIASLYYDTDSFALIRRSLEKPFYKEKLRLRSYGLAKEDSPVYLEIKRKNAGIVYKRRAASTEKQVEAFLNEGIPLGQEQIERELFAFKEKYGALHPQYLILYDRVAYYEEGGDLRLTIDHNPRYRVDELNLHTSLEGKPLLGEEKAILEVKAQQSIPLWLCEILTQGKIYPSSCSKVGTAHRLEKSRPAKPLAHRPYEVEKGKRTYGIAI